MAVLTKHERSFKFDLSIDRTMGLVLQAKKVLVVAPLVCFYTGTVVLQILWDILRYGPRTVFSKTVREQPPACLQDPSLGIHGYVHLEDVRLHYVTNGADGKPLMLLIHGFPEFWYSWRHQLREFKDDYKVVAIDQRGYGESDKPSSVSDYDVKKLVNDIRQLIPALGYDKCVLVAHDWGGKVAWSFAQQHPDMVDKLVVMNCPSTRAYQLHVRSHPSQIRASWYFFFFQVPYLPELFLQKRDIAFLNDLFIGSFFGVRSGKMTSDDVEAYKYTFSKSGFTAPINYYRQMIRSEDFMAPSNETERLVTRSTLIIWGDQDKALATPMAIESVKSVEGGATLKLIEGASHWVQMDQPELVNKYMWEFLKSK